MADYNITLADGVTVVTITEGAPLNTYTIPLVGQNTTTYGDDIAKAFLNLTENFASSTAPESNASLVGSVPHTVLPGQLWYDAGNSVLKVNTASSPSISPTWQSIAGVNKGTTTSSMLRWSGTSWIEETQMRVTSGGTLQLFDTGLSGWASFQHAGGDFTIATNATADIHVAESGTRVSLPSMSDVSLSTLDHPFQIGLDSSTNLRMDNNEILAVNNGAQSDLNLQTDGGDVVIGLAGGTSSIFLRHRAADAATKTNMGQIWVNSGDGELYFTGTDDVAHQISNVSAGGTVGGSGSNNQIATWSGTSTLDGSANLTFDGTTFQFNSSTFGQFVIDRTTADGGAAIRYQNNDGIKGYAGFNDAQQFEVYNNAAGSTGFLVSNNGVVAANGVNLGDNDPIWLGSGTDVTIDFDGTDLNIDGTAGATDLNLDGFGAVVLTEPTSLRFDAVDDYTGNAILFNQVSGTDGNVTGSMHWRDNLLNFRANVGFIGFSATGGLLSMVCDGDGIIYLNSGQDGELWIDDGIAMYHLDVISLGTQVRTAGNDNTSSAFVYSAAGAQYDIGYNITPTQGLAPGATYSLSKNDASKYFSKDGILASSTVEVTNNADIPVGFSIVIANDGTTVGSITILEGVNCSLQWLDGSGSPPTGTRTLAIGGVCTVRKATENPGSTDRWVIWGSGLT